jgi:4-hydroxybenzoate polyprenyltransferase
MSSAASRMPVPPNAESWARFPPATTAARLGWARDWITLMRPEHWVKNSFVAAPLAFAHLSMPAMDALRAAALATIAFCLMSSSVYCFNDVRDAPTDRAHPKKCGRPVAAGRVSPSTALLLAAALAAGAGAIAWIALPFGFAVAAAAYLANNILYTFVLKEKVIADVMAIALGFVLRLLAGSAAIGVVPSSWLLVCGFSVALLLGFGKRRVELTLARPTAYRAALRMYTADKLDTVLGACTAVAMLSYILYTVSPETIRLHHTDKLVYTIPFVAYGLFRYVFKVQEGVGTGPVDILLSDRIFLLNGLLWIGAVVAIRMLALGS